MDHTKYSTLNFDFLQNHWWVVALSNEVTATQPLKVRLLGCDYVLFRGSNREIVCFEDRCPHRQVPLSLGRVVDCKLQCSYHGWEFDNTGMCTKVPGRIGEEFQQPFLSPLLTHEADGLIWLCASKEPNRGVPFSTPHLSSSDMKTRIHKFQIATNMVDILENFMDPFHTAILHDGLIRKDTIRSLNRIMPRHTEDGFEVRYTKEKPQSTWFRRFQRNIDLDLGRFRMPGIVELEFYAEQTLEFANAFYITPVDHQNVLMTTVISIKPRLIPPWLLFLVAKPILMRALKQDIVMLEVQNMAGQRYPQRKQISLETDIVRRQLELFFSGRTDRVQFREFEAML